MRGTQGPMWQNQSKADTLATERAAHEACDTHHGKRGDDDSKSSQPAREADDSDRKGGY
jgi:hypothetical protein